MVDCRLSKVDVPICGVRELLERLVLVPLLLELDELFELLVLRELPELEGRDWRSWIEGLLDLFDLEGDVLLLERSKFELLREVDPLCLPLEPELILLPLDLPDTPDLSVVLLRLLGLVASRVLRSG